MAGTTRVTAIMILAKKLGGTRQIGIITSLVRIYTKVRYLDMRCQLEARLERPYFYAAPGKGGVKAVARQAVVTEQALAQEGGGAASSLHRRGVRILIETRCAKMRGAPHHASIPWRKVHHHAWICGQAYLPNESYHSWMLLGNINRQGVRDAICGRYGR